MPPSNDPTLNGYLYGWRANKFNLETFKITSPIRTTVEWDDQPRTAECMHKDFYQFALGMYHPFVMGSLGMGFPFGSAPLEHDSEGEDPRTSPLEHTECPQDWCMCGYYAFDSLNSYIDGMDYEDNKEAIYIMTLVRMWGVIIQHEKGYRAQYVTADTVFLPEKHEFFEHLILQSLDVVVEPIEYAVDYDRSLPRVEDYESQGE